MRSGRVAVECHGLLRRVPPTSQQFLARIRTSICPYIAQETEGEAHEPIAIGRVQPNRPVKKRSRSRVALRRIQVQERHALDVAFPCAQILRLLFNDVLELGLFQLRLDDCGDPLGGLFLELEDIGRSKVEFLHPEVMPTFAFDQSGGNSNLIRGAANRTLDEIAGVQLVRDACSINRLIAIGEGRAAGDQGEASPSSQRADHFLSKTIAQNPTAWIVRKIFERQHRDRWTLQ